MMLHVAAIPPMQQSMNASTKNWVVAAGLVAVGVALGALGIYIGETDDAPGAALIGLLLMIGAVVLGVRVAPAHAIARTLD